MGVDGVLAGVVASVTRNLLRTGNEKSCYSTSPVEAPTFSRSENNRQVGNNLARPS